MPKKENLQLVFADTISAPSDHFLVSNPIAITTTTLTCLRAFRFCSWDQELHSDGLLPMAFVPPGVSPSHKTFNAQYLYALQSRGFTPLSLTLTNIVELPAARGYIYTQWSEAVLQLDACPPLLASLIGYNHPVGVSYQERLREFRKNPVAIQAALSDRYRTEIGAIVFVHYFHVWVRGYLSMQWDSSMRMKNVPDLFNAFVHFVMTSEVSHFPDPSDIPVLRCIVSRKVLINRLHPNRRDIRKLLLRVRNPLRNNLMSKISILTRQLISVAPSCALAFKKTHHADLRKNERQGGRCLCNNGEEMCHTFHLRGKCSSNYYRFVHDHPKQSATKAACLLGPNKLSPEKLAGNILIQLLLCLFLPSIGCKPLCIAQQRSHVDPLQQAIWFCNPL